MESWIEGQVPRREFYVLYVLWILIYINRELWNKLILSS